MNKKHSGNLARLAMNALDILAVVNQAPVWYRTFVSILEYPLKVVEMFLITQDVRSRAMVMARDAMKFLPIGSDAGKLSGGMKATWSRAGKQDLLMYLFFGCPRTAYEILAVLGAVAIGIPLLLLLMHRLSRYGRVFVWIFMPVVLTVDILCIIFYNSLISSGMELVDTLIFSKQIGQLVTSPQIMLREAGFLVLIAIFELLLILEYFALTMVRVDHILVKPTAKIPRRPFSSKNHTIQMLSNIYILVATILSDFNDSLPVKAPLLCLFCLYIYVALEIDNKFFFRVGNVCACLGFGYVLAVSLYNVVIWLLYTTSSISDVTRVPLARFYGQTEQLSRINEPGIFALTTIGMACVIVAATVVVKKSFTNRVVEEVHAHARGFSSTTSLSTKPNKTIGADAIAVAHNNSYESDMSFATRMPRLAHVSHVPNINSNTRGGNIDKVNNSNKDNEVIHHHQSNPNNNAPKSCIVDVSSLSGKRRLYMSDRSLHIYGVPILLLPNSYSLDSESVLEAATTRLDLLQSRKATMLSRYHRTKNILLLHCYILELRRAFERHQSRHKPQDRLKFISVCGYGALTQRFNQSFNKLITFNIQLSTSAKNLHAFYSSHKAQSLCPPVKFPQTLPGPCTNSYLAPKPNTEANSVVIPRLFGNSTFVNPANNIANTTASTNFTFSNSTSPLSNETYETACREVLALHKSYAGAIHYASKSLRLFRQIRNSIYRDRATPSFVRHVRHVLTKPIGKILFTLSDEDAKLRRKHKGIIILSGVLAALASGYMIFQTVNSINLVNEMKVVREAELSRLGSVLGVEHAFYYKLANQNPLVISDMFADDLYVRPSIGVYVEEKDLYLITSDNINSRTNLEVGYIDHKINIDNLYYLTMLLNTDATLYPASSSGETASNNAFQDAVGIEASYAKNSYHTRNRFGEPKLSTSSEESDNIYITESCSGVYTVATFSEDITDKVIATTCVNEDVIRCYFLQRSLSIPLWLKYSNLGTSSTTGLSLKSSRAKPGFSSSPIEALTRFHPSSYFQEYESLNKLLNITSLDSEGVYSAPSFFSALTVSLGNIYCVFDTLNTRTLDRGDKIQGRALQELLRLFNININHLLLIASASLDSVTSRTSLLIAFVSLPSPLATGIGMLLLSVLVFSALNLLNHLGTIRGMTFSTTLHSILSKSQPTKLHPSGTQKSLEPPKAAGASDNKKGATKTEKRNKGKHKDKAKSKEEKKTPGLDIVALRVKPSRYILFCIPAILVVVVLGSLSSYYGFATASMEITVDSLYQLGRDVDIQLVTGSLSYAACVLQFTTTPTDAARRCLNVYGNDKPYVFRHVPTPPPSHSNATGSATVYVPRNMPSLTAILVPSFPRPAATAVNTFARERLLDFTEKRLFMCGPRVGVITPNCSSSIRKFLGHALFGNRATSGSTPIVYDYTDLLNAFEETKLDDLIPDNVVAEIRALMASLNDLVSTPALVPKPQRVVALKGEVLGAYGGSLSLLILLAAISCAATSIIRSQQKSINDAATGVNLKDRVLPPATVRMGKTVGILATAVNILSIAICLFLGVHIAFVLSLPPPANESHDPTGLDRSLGSADSMVAAEALVAMINVLVYAKTSDPQDLTNARLAASLMNARLALPPSQPYDSSIVNNINADSLIGRVNNAIAILLKARSITGEPLPGEEESPENREIQRKAAYSVLLSPAAANQLETPSSGIPLVSPSLPSTILSPIDLTLMIHVIFVIVLFINLNIMGFIALVNHFTDQCLRIRPHIVPLGPIKSRTNKIQDPNNQLETVEDLDHQQQGHTGHGRKMVTTNNGRTMIPNIYLGQKNPTNTLESPDTLEGENMEVFPSGSSSITPHHTDSMINTSFNTVRHTQRLESESVTRSSPHVGSDMTLHPSLPSSFNYGHNKFLSGKGTYSLTSITDTAQSPHQQYYPKSGFDSSSTDSLIESEEGDKTSSAQPASSVVSQRKSKIKEEEISMAPVTALYTFPIGRAQTQPIVRHSCASTMVISLVLAAIIVIVVVFQLLCPLLFSTHIETIDKTLASASSLLLLLRSYVKLAADTALLIPAASVDVITEFNNHSKDLVDRFGTFDSEFRDVLRAVQDFVRPDPYKVLDDEPKIEDIYCPGLISFDNFLYVNNYDSPDSPALLMSYFTDILDNGAAISHIIYYYPLAGDSKYYDYFQKLGKGTFVIFENMNDQLKADYSLYYKASQLLEAYLRFYENFILALSLYCDKEISNYLSKTILPIMWVATIAAIAVVIALIALIVHVISGQLRHEFAFLELLSIRSAQIMERQTLATKKTTLVGKMEGAERAALRSDMQESDTLHTQRRHNLGPR